MLNSFLTSNNWDIVNTQILNTKLGQIFAMTDVNLSTASKRLLNSKYAEGLYLHQKMAIQECQKEKDVCMTTGTASGKSLPFYITGIEILQKDPGAKILALYPLKALGNEQEQRWNEALRDAGLEAKTGRIDGSVATNRRKDILKKANNHSSNP